MSMRNIFIIHGSYGHPGENWFPWLKSELEKLDHRVFVPAFPVPKTEATGDHKLDLWMKELDGYKEYIDKEVIFVAHSRGCLFTYRILEQQIPLYAAFLVAPWITKYLAGGWTRDDLSQKDPFDWGKMRNGAKHIEVFQSTNDEIPVNEGKQVAQNLGAEFILVENAGHFNVATDPKFKEFDLLLERIKKIL